MDGEEDTGWTLLALTLLRVDLVHHLVSASLVSEVLSLRSVVVLDRVVEEKVPGN